MNVALNQTPVDPIRIITSGMGFLSGLLVSSVTERSMYIARWLLVNYIRSLAHFTINAARKAVAMHC